MKSTPHPVDRKLYHNLQASVPGWMDSERVNETMEQRCVFVLGTKVARGKMSQPVFFF